MSDQTNKIFKLCGICEHKIDIQKPANPYKDIICKNCNAHYLPYETTPAYAGIMARRLFRYSAVASISYSVYLLSQIFPILQQKIWVTVLIGMIISLIPFTIEILLFKPEHRHYELKLVSTPTSRSSQASQ